MAIKAKKKAVSSAKKKAVSSAKKKAVSSTKVIKKEPNHSALLKKVASVSDSNKTLQKEIKIMSKIFGENQKVLISMKGMIDTLTSTLENIQKQSKQINIIEEDTQKLYAGLNQVRTQSNMITKINDQTSKLQEEINRISDIQKASKSLELSQQVEDSINSIRNNSQMIIKIAQRIDEVRDDLRKVSGKTDSFSDIGLEISNLKNSVDGISEKTSDLESGAKVVENLKQDLEKIKEGIESASKIDSELNSIKTSIDDISSKASKIDSLQGIIDGLNQQFETVSAKAISVDNQGIESIKELSGKIDKIETEIGALSQRADSTAFVGEGLKSVQDDFSSFKQNVFDKTDSIEQKISSVSDIVKKQDESSSELHKKSKELFEEIQSVKEVTNKTSSKSSKEIMSLLKLSEFQSSIRMNAESKYGDAKAIESMAIQTREIVNLFDKMSTETSERISIPHEIKQWAISKIFDCADRWEIRFSDTYSILTNSIGRDILKEIIRIKQIRDIYGIRAVDEIRKDLNIS